MVMFGLLMKVIDKIDEQRDEANDNLILKTTYYGLDGKASPGKMTWGMVAETWRNENERAEREAQKSQRPT